MKLDASNWMLQWLDENKEDVRIDSTVVSTLDSIFERSEADYFQSAFALSSSCDIISFTFLIIGIDEKHFGSKSELDIAADEFICLWLVCSKLEHRADYILCHNR